MSYHGTEHVEQELAGVISRLQLLEEIRDQRGRGPSAVPVVLSSPELDALKRQVNGLVAEVKKLAKIVEHQQCAIEELSLGADV